MKTFEDAVARAVEGGARCSYGGKRHHRRAVRTTATSSSRRSSTALPTDHPVFQEEFFVPITAVADVLTLDQAIDLANRTEYGLTAGIFSEDDKEIEHVLQPHRGWRHLRQPPLRRDDGRVARHQPVRRLEGQRLDRPRHRRPVLRAAVHARAEPGRTEIGYRLEVEVGREVETPYGSQLPASALQPRTTTFNLHTDLQPRPLTSGTPTSNPYPLASSHVRRLVHAGAPASARHEVPLPGRTRNHDHAR